MPWILWDAWEATERPVDEDLDGSRGELQHPVVPRRRWLPPAARRAGAVVFVLALVGVWGTLFVELTFKSGSAGSPSIATPPAATTPASPVDRQPLPGAEAGDSSTPAPTEPPTPSPSSTPTPSPSRTPSRSAPPARIVLLTPSPTPGTTPSSTATPYGSPSASPSASPVGSPSPSPSPSPHG